MYKRQEYNNLIYLSCDFGISTYDLERLEFGDTYFIGSGGSQISVKQTTVKDEYIYAATESNGIKRAEHADGDIIDFSLWTTITSGVLTDWKSIVTFNDTIYAIAANRSIYEYNLTTFNNLFTYTDTTVDHRVNGDKMLVTIANRVYLYDAPFTTSLVINYLPEYGSDFTVATVLNDKIYIGTDSNGVLHFNVSDGINTGKIVPNGPNGNNHFGIKADQDQLWAVYGDHTISYNPGGGSSLPDVQGYNYFKDNVWTYKTHSEALNARSLIDMSVNPFNPNQVFISSYYSGLLEVNDGVATTLFDTTNPNLDGIAGTPQLRVGKSTFDNNGKLWFTNNIAGDPLKSYNPQDNSWETYGLQPVVTYTDASVPVSHNETGFGDLIIDQNNNKWIAGYKKGVIGFSTNSGSPVVNNIDFATGNLPSNVITGLAIDNDNNLWIGTIQGLRVLYNTSGFFTTANPTAERVIILDDGIPKELMFGQFITDIEVDGSNNKWISTFDSGVFYLSSNGQETIYHFTTDNSPLPTDNVTDMTIDNSTGTVYFATPKGMVAFKGLSTNSASDLSNVIVYPNPVRPEYVKESLGYDASDIGKGIKIKGITKKVNIKITDISGKLVADSNTSSKSSNLSVNEGSFAIWNGKNFNNNIVASGVYVIMITDLDSSETTIEKVMIIR